MIIIEFLSAVSKQVIAWYGRGYVDDFAKNIRKFIASGKLEIDYVKAKKWLVNYYINNGQGQFLFTLDSGKKVPYLTKTEWSWPNLPKIPFDFRLISSACRGKVDKNLISLRKNSGQNLWDGPIYVLNGISQDYNSLTINLIEGTYFQYATVATHLTKEINSCLQDISYSPILRNDKARTIYNLENGDTDSQIIGVTVAVILNFPEGPKLLLQKRSLETGVAAGFYAVVPAFVCSPELKLDPSGMDANNFLFHFFLKEFFEELYDQKELINEASYFTPDWFYSHKPIANLIELRDLGKMKFEVLGFGFDAYTSELNISCVAFINDETYVFEEYRRMKRNWEINNIELIDLSSQKLRELILSDSIYITSAYTLSMLLKWKNKIELLQNHIINNADSGQNRK